MDSNTGRFNTCQFPDLLTTDTFVPGFINFRISFRAGKWYYQRQSGSLRPSQGEGLRKFIRGLIILQRDYEIRVLVLSEASKVAISAMLGVANAMYCQLCLSHQ